MAVLKDSVATEYIVVLSVGEIKTNWLNYGWRISPLDSRLPDFPVRHTAPPPEWRTEAKIMKKAPEDGHGEEEQLVRLLGPSRV